MGRQTLWTDEKVEEKIIEIIKELDIDYMPSYNEIVQYMKHKKLKPYGLVNTISKGYGYDGWARKLGIESKYEHKKNKRKKTVPIAVVRKQNKFVDTERLKKDAEREKRYAEQCKPSQVKIYKLSQQELEIYRKMKKPDEYYSKNMLEFFYKGYF